MEQTLTQTRQSKKATKKIKGIQFVNGKKGMEVAQLGDNTNVSENTTGAKIKAAKKLGAEMLEKIAINNAEKQRRRSLTYNLNALKGSAEKYAEMLGNKYGVNVSIDELTEALKKPKVFLAYLSEKQKTQFEAKKLGFSYWLILGLVSKYFKAHKPKKTA